MTYIKHGETKTKLCGLWRNIRYRCNCKTSKDYSNYGARGITFFEGWNDYIVFKNWALSNGYKEGLSIERKDTNKGYNPDNCTFITIAENNKNRTNTKFWFINGIKFSSSKDAAIFFKVGQSTILRWCQGDNQFHKANGKRYKYPPKENCYMEHKYAKDS